MKARWRYYSPIKYIWADITVIDYTVRQHFNAWLCFKEQFNTRKVNIFGIGSAGVASNVLFIIDSLVLFVAHYIHENCD